MSEMSSCSRESTPEMARSLVIVSIVSSALVLGYDAVVDALTIRISRLLSAVCSSFLRSSRRFSRPLRCYLHRGVVVAESNVSV